jgi:homocysteine S-methyltransferase
MGARDRLNERLGSGEVVILDGGMGTELQARGVPMSNAAWSGLANLDHSDIVKQIHEDNIRAGADVVIANTFATSRLMLRAAGVEDRFEEANKRAVEAAIAARDATGRPDVAVAGSISDGVAGVADDFTDQVPLEGRALRDAFSEHAQTLADAGADLLVLEMMTSPSYGVVAVETALETGLPVWLGVSAGLSLEGTLCALGGEDGSFEALLAALVRPELAAVTVMHTSVEATTPALEAVRKAWAGPLGAYPESGSWIPPNWVFNDFTPEAFASAALGWVRDGGVRIVGGCCGMGPRFIAALHDALVPNS